MATKAMHGPFNLMFRLLVELCSGIIIPVSEDAAKALDKERLPFQSSTGHMESLSVSKQTAVETQIQVLTDSVLYTAEQNGSRGAGAVTTVIWGSAESKLNRITLQQYDECSSLWCATCFLCLGYVHAILKQACCSVGRSASTSWRYREWTCKCAVAAT